MAMFNDNKAVDATGNELNFLYEMLFCDELSLFEEVLEDTKVYPWQVLFDPAATPAELYELIDLASNETRIKLLAYQRLQQANQPILKQELLGVIIEVGLQDGLDVLAAYQDGTARYLHHSGKVIMWESANEQSQVLIDTLFEESEKVVRQIGVWPRGRLNPPKKGNARISFLVSNGLYFGEADCDVLFSDELAGPALLAATALLNYLTSKVQA
ncbi:hypothetical protein [Dyadobacter crusticola]|uniref:hypothetical protein n=1 Tax=Dyadobacter crusticola TaxID=292407 RepID=UPI0012FB98D5|nr:hypothetical protein [Dyadobacter crusticola]